MSIFKLEIENYIEIEKLYGNKKLDQKLFHHENFLEKHEKMLSLSPHFC